MFSSYGFICTNETMESQIAKVRLTICFAGRTARLKGELINIWSEFRAKGNKILGGIIYAAVFNQYCLAQRVFGNHLVLDWKGFKRIFLDV